MASPNTGQACIKQDIRGKKTTHRFGYGCCHVNVPLVVTHQQKASQDILYIMLMDTLTNAVSVRGTEWIRSYLVSRQWPLKNTDRGQAPRCYFKTWPAEPGWHTKLFLATGSKGELTFPAEPCHSQTFSEKSTGWEYTFTLPGNYVSVSETTTTTTTQK